MHGRNYLSVVASLSIALLATDVLALTGASSRLVGKRVGVTLDHARFHDGDLTSANLMVDAAWTTGPGSVRVRVPYVIEPSGDAVSGEAGLGIPQVGYGIELPIGPLSLIAGVDVGIDMAGDKVVGLAPWRAGELAGGAGFVEPSAMVELDLVVIKAMAHAAVLRPILEDDGVDAPTLLRGGATAGLAMLPIGIELDLIRDLDDPDNQTVFVSPGIGVDLSVAKISLKVPVQIDGPDNGFDWGIAANLNIGL